MLKLCFFLLFFVSWFLGGVFARPRGAHPGRGRVWVLLQAGQGAVQPYGVWFERRGGGGVSQRTGGGAYHYNWMIECKSRMSIMRCLQRVGAFSCFLDVLICIFIFILSLFIFLFLFVCYCFIYVLRRFITFILWFWSRLAWFDFFVDAPAISCSMFFLLFPRFPFPPRSPFFSPFFHRRVHFEYCYLWWW